MKPAPFKYIAASSLDQALALKAEYGDEARFLAGGQSLIPAMNFRLARPEVLIDINPLSELAGIDRSDGETIRVGAVTRYRALERDAGFLNACPLFADALPHIAHPQIRNRGTIGGNLSHADPASELPAVATAMQARMKIRSSQGERELSASEFFVDLLTTCLEPEEMLVEIAFPASPPRSGSCFMEVARRRGDFALAGVAAIVSLDEDGQFTDVRLALPNLLRPNDAQALYVIVFAFFLQRFEIRFFMPVLNVPFRLIFAFNPQRSGVLDSTLQPQSAFQFRFAVGSTF